MGEAHTPETEAAVERIFHVINTGYDRELTKVIRTELEAAYQRGVREVTMIVLSAVMVSREALSPEERRLGELRD